MNDVLALFLVFLTFASLVFGIVSFVLYLDRSSKSGIYCRSISEKYIDYNIIEVVVADGVKAEIQQHICQSADGKVNVYVGWNE
jgi:hypothetical protein